MSVQVSYKKQLLFGIISLIVILILIEVFANIWIFEINKCAFEKSELFEDIDPKIKRDLCQRFYDTQFGTNKVFVLRQLGGQGAIESGRIYTNNEGFRGPEFSQFKEDNVFRIFLVGGSTIYSAGVSDSQTVSSYMQKYFDQDDLDFKVEVINVGIGGVYSEIETRLIKERLMFYNPDLFIVYDGWNELERIRTPDFFSIPTQQLISTFKDQNIMGKTDPVLWKNGWIEICEIGKENDFDTIITLQPIAGTGKRVLTDDEYRSYFEHRSQDLLKPYPSFAQQLTDLEKFCTGAYDLREMFDEIEKPVYYDEGHVASLGNSIVAKNFYDIALPLAVKKMEVKNVNELKTYQNKNILKYYIEEKTEDYNSIEFRINQFLDLHDSPQKIFNFILYQYKTPSAVSSIIIELQKNSISKYNSQETNELFFNNENLESQKFNNKNFTNVVFKKLNLEKSSFENINLINAKFIESNLNFVTIKNSTLSKISIIRSDLNNSTIINSEFDNSIIAYVKWSNSDFSDVSFTNSRFLKTVFDNSNFESVDFSYADLSNQDLSKANFKNINFQNTYLKNSNLSNVDFRKSNVIYANFENADLSNANLSRQKLTGVTLINANLTNANLSNIDLEGMDFSNTILTGVNFTNSNLDNIIMTNAVIDSEYSGCINHNLCK